MTAPYTMSELRSMAAASRIEDLRLDDMLEFAKELPPDDTLPSHIEGSKGFLEALKTWVVTAQDASSAFATGLPVRLDKKLRGRSFRIVSNAGSILYEGVLPTQEEFRRQPHLYS
jgi:hypothetical protein